MKTSIAFMLGLVFGGMLGMLVTVVIVAGDKR